MSFDQRGGELCHLLFDFLPRHHQRGSADSLRSTAEGADPLLHDSGIAVENRDVLERNAELIGEHLRERRLVALTVRRSASRRADAAVALDRHLRMFPSAGRKRRRRSDAADLDVDREPETDEPSLRTRGVTFCFQAVPRDCFSARSSAFS